MVAQWILVLFMNSAGSAFAPPISYASESDCILAGQHAVDSARTRTPRAAALGFVCIPDTVAVQRGDVP